MVMLTEDIFCSSVSRCLTKGVKVCAVYARLVRVLGEYKSRVRRSVRASSATQYVLLHVLSSVLLVVGTKPGDELICDLFESSAHT
jgi:hypothetical protein